MLTGFKKGFEFPFEFCVQFRVAGLSPWDYSFEIIHPKDRVND